MKKQSNNRVWVLILLTLIYSSAYIDRTIIMVVGEAIKDDLQLSNAQLGLLGGLAFVLFYTTLGIPIARLAERYSRTRIIAVSIVAWSTMTMLCGITKSFGQLFLCRMGVAVGEAGCAPPSHSLIADYFGPKRRATALAVYSLAIPIGLLAGGIMGGYFVDEFGWRMAFVAAGLPGIVLALLILLVKEPVRGAQDSIQQQTDEYVPTFMQVSRQLLNCRTFCWVLAGVTLTAFATYGLMQFNAPYFIRRFGLDYTQVGIIVGLIGGLSAGGGAMIGGVAADFLGARDRRWLSWLPALGLFIAVPLYALGYTQDSYQWAFGLLLIPGFFQYMHFAPSMATMHGLVTARMRASSTALILLIINIIGGGLGPFVTGLVIDMAAGDCVATEVVCQAQQVTATQAGLFLNVAILLPAGVCYLFAAKHIRRDLNY